MDTKNPYAETPEKKKVDDAGESREEMVDIEKIIKKVFSDPDLAKKVEESQRKYGTLTAKDLQEIYDSNLGAYVPQIPISKAYVPKTPF